MNISTEKLQKLNAIINSYKKKNVSIHAVSRTSTNCSHSCAGTCMGSCYTMCANSAHNR